MMGELERRGLSDLAKLWRAAGLSDDFRDMILSAFPELVIQWGSIAADFAAIWYDEAAPNLRYRARVPDPPPLTKFALSAAWALNVGTAETAPLMLGGTLQRGVWDMARETTIYNVRREPGASWERKARADACDFCLERSGDDFTEQNPMAYEYHDNCHCVAVEVRPN